MQYDYWNAEAGIVDRFYHYRGSTSTKRKLNAFLFFPFIYLCDLGERLLYVKIISISNDRNQMSVDRQDNNNYN